MRMVEFEFDGAIFTLPRFGELPVRCFQDRKYSTLIRNAPDGFLDFMWDMSADEAKGFVRAWTAATREAERAEAPGLTRLESFNRWVDRNHRRVFLGFWCALVVAGIVSLVIERV